MTTLVHLTPYVAFSLGVAMMMRALHLYSESRPQTPVSSWQKLAVWFGAMLAWPTLAHAQAWSTTICFRQRRQSDFDMSFDCRWGCGVGDGGVEVRGQRHT